MNRNISLNYNTKSELESVIHNVEHNLRKLKRDLDLYNGVDLICENCGYTYTFIKKNLLDLPSCPKCKLDSPKSPKGKKKLRKKTSGRKKRKGSKKRNKR